MQQIPQANQEPLLNKTKNIDFESPKRAGLKSKERIAIIFLSIIIVALLLVIVFLLFNQTSSYYDDNIVPITIPARKINSQVNIARSTTAYNPYLDYAGNVNKERNLDGISVEEEQEKQEEDFIEEDMEKHIYEDQDSQSYNRGFIDRLSGTWYLISSENFDQVMEKLGVSWFKRKLAGNLKPTVIISKKSNDQYSIRTVTNMKTSEIVFSLDEPFKQTIDDKDVKTTITLEGDRLVQIQRDSSTNTRVICTIIREIDENDLMITYIQVDNVVCKRVFKRS
jgi:hypothetical protein